MNEEDENTWDRIRSQREERIDGWLHDEFRRWLKSLRLLSKEFNTIVLPLVYGMVDLSNAPSAASMSLISNIGSPSPFDTYIIIKLNVIKYTKKLLFKAQNDQKFLSQAVDIVSRAERLVEVQYDRSSVLLVRIYMLMFNRWYTTEENMEWTSICISAVLRPILIRSPHCRIAECWKHLTIQTSTTNIKEACREETILTIDPRYVPNARVGEMPVPTAAPLPITPPLSVLEINGGNERDKFFQSNAVLRFPPMITLKLEYLTWVYTQENYRQVWDFSRLESLTLDFCGLEGFLSSVSLDELANLHTFKILGSEETHNYAALRPLLRDVLSNFNRLRRLDIAFTNWEQLMPLSSIIENLGDTIQWLRLRDWGEQAVPISLEALSSLRVGCPNLRYLGLDWTEVESDVSLCPSPVAFASSSSLVKSLVCFTR